jgi:hypothetical protein
MRLDIFQSFGGFDEQRYRRPAIEDIELGTWVSAAGQRLCSTRPFRRNISSAGPLGIIKTDVVDRGIPWTRLMASRPACEVSQRDTSSKTERCSSLPDATRGCLIGPLGLQAGRSAGTLSDCNSAQPRLLLVSSAARWFLVLRPLHTASLALSMVLRFCAAWGTLIHFSGAGSPPRRSEVAQ